MTGESIFQSTDNIITFRGDFSLDVSNLCEYFILHIGNTLQETTIFHSFPAIFQTLNCIGTFGFNPCFRIAKFGFDFSRKLSNPAQQIW